MRDLVEGSLEFDGGGMIGASLRKMRKLFVRKGSIFNPGLHSYLCLTPMEGVCLSQHAMLISCINYHVSEINCIISFHMPRQLFPMLWPAIRPETFCSCSELTAYGLLGA